MYPAAPSSGRETMDHTDDSDDSATSSTAAEMRSRLAPVTSRVRARFEADTRSLAAIRIGLGLVILVDLLHRATAMEMFYTDAGVYPRSAFEATYSQFDISLHALSGSLWFQQLLFVVAGAFAVAFVLGYRTRLVGVISLVFLVSLHARNPGVLNGGDRLFRVMLLVSLAAPLGERWSIDALRRGEARTSVASFGTAALLIQPLVVLTSNAILKHRGEHWYAGEALEIALSNDMMTILLGNVLVEYPAVLTVLNYVWVTLLAGSVPFLLLTVGRARALAALAYMGVFSGMIVTMTVGVFPLVLMSSMLPFLTAAFWDTVAKRLPSRWAKRLPTAAQLGPLGRPPVEQRLLAVLRNRDHEFAASYIVTYGRSFLTIVGFLMVVWILLYSVPDVTAYELPEELDNTNLDQQSWGLYAPDPTEAYSWYPVEARLDDGSTVNALDDGDLAFKHPPDVSAEYDSFRHRKYLQKVRDAGKGDTNGVIAQRYADWACRQANDRYDGQAERVTVYRMYQPSPIDGAREDPTKVTVIEQSCR